MARTPRNDDLSTRTGRLKLATRTFHTQTIGQDLALVYRRGKKSSAWSVRLGQGANQYTYAKLGEADDYRDADGEEVMTYLQAIEACRDWLKARREAEEAARVARQVQEALSKVYTVADAVKAYVSAGKRDGSEKASRRDIERRLAKHVLPELGDLKIAPVMELTQDRLETWKKALAGKPAHTRGGHPRASTDRARKANVNRVWSYLRAALNLAYRDSSIGVPTNAPWRGVVPFHLPKAQITYLTDVEARRLVNATEGRFRDLVRAALMTGGRYGELARLRVMDYDPAAGNIFIAESKGGESRHIPLAREGRAFFDARTAGKARDALVFIPEEGDHWGRSLQTARMKEACTRAGIRPAVTFHALRHTYASLLASAGVPLKVIATLLGHSSVSVTEKHTPT